MEEIDSFFRNYPIYLNKNIRREMDNLWTNNKDTIITKPGLKVKVRCSTNDLMIPSLMVTMRG